MDQCIGKVFSAGGGYSISGVKSFPPKGEQFEYIKPPINPFIIPPVAAKMEISDTYLKKVWLRAHKCLRSASVWVVWGYSFPQTDTITSVLLKTCVKESRGRQKKVIIVNPDYSVSERVKALLGKVRVEKHSTMSDFLVRYKWIQLESHN